MFYKDFVPWINFFCQISQTRDQQIMACGPKYSLPLLFVNKILLEHSHAHHLYIVYAYFHIEGRLG